MSAPLRPPLPRGHPQRSQMLEASRGMPRQGEIPSSQRLSWHDGHEEGKYYAREIGDGERHLSGLLAKIKCSICSYQFNIWYMRHCLIRY